VLRLTGVVFKRLPGIAVPEVLPGERGTDPRPQLGFNQSSQRSCALTVSACQMPLRVFSSQGFCEASC